MDSQWIWAAALVRSLDGFSSVNLGQKVFRGLNYSNVIGHRERVKVQKNWRILLSVIHLCSLKEEITSCNETYFLRTKVTRKNQINLWMYRKMMNERKKGIKKLIDEAYKYIAISISIFS